MSEQEKKQQRIYDLLYAKTNPKFPCLLYTNKILSFYSKRDFLRKKGSVGLKKKKTKEDFLTAPASAIKLGLLTSIRKCANQLISHNKTVRTAILQDLNPDIKPPWLHYRERFRK